MDADGTRTPDADPAVTDSLALGTWPLADGGPGGYGYGPCAPDLARDTVRAALDLGLRRVDTAAAFGDGAVEAMLGRLLGARDDVAVTTRVGFTRTKNRPLPDFRPEAITAQAEASARRLGRAPIDRVLLYTPSSTTLRHGHALEALLALKARDLARAVGVSVNEPAEARLAAAAGVDWVCLPYHLMNRKHEAFLAEAPRLGVRVQAREPLHNGLLAGEPAAFAPDDMRRTWPAFYLDRARRVRERVRQALPERPVAAAALGYVLGHPGISEVVVGCRGAGEVRAACATRPLDAAARVRLERAVYAPPRAAASMASISASDSP